MVNWANILSPFERNAGATGDLASLGTRYAWPPQYLELLAFMDGGEGFIGENHVRIFAHKDPVWLNEATALREIRDGLFIFGSTGGGEGFAFDQQAGNRIVQVPFIPLVREHLIAIAEELRTWLSS